MKVRFGPDGTVLIGHSDVTTTLNVYGHLLNSDLTHLGDIMDSMVG